VQIFSIVPEDLLLQDIRFIEEMKIKEYEKLTAVCK